MSDYVKKIHPRTRSMNLKLSPFLKEKPIETQTPNFCQFHPVLEFLGQRGTFSETSLVSTKKNPPFPVSENHPHLQLRPSTGDAQKMPGVLGIPVMKNTGIPRRFTPNLTIFFNVGKTIPEKKKKHPNQPWQWLENFQQIQWWKWGQSLWVVSPFPPIFCFGCFRVIWSEETQPDPQFSTWFQLLHPKVSNRRQLRNDKPLTDSQPPLNHHFLKEIPLKKWSVISTSAVPTRENRHHVWLCCYRIWKILL